MEKMKLVNVVFIITAFVLTTSCSSNYMTSHSILGTPIKTVDNHAPLWEGNAATIWAKLQLNSSAKLLTMKNQMNDPVKHGWLELAILSKQKNISTNQFAMRILQWRTHYSNHPANALLPDDNTLHQLASQRPPTQIAVLLPQSGPYASSGRVVREGFLNAYYAHSPSIGKQNVKFYDTHRTANMNMLYQQASQNGADFIVGPLLKDNVRQMSGGKFTVPVIALNYTQQFFSLPNNFYEYGLLPEDEAAQIANRAREAGLAHALVIAPENDWGKRLTAAFSSRWQSLGGNIQDHWYYEANPDFNEGIARLLKVNPINNKNQTQKDNNKDLLEQQRRHDFDVVFVFAQSVDAHGIIPMLRYYYTGSIPIYASSSIYANKSSATNDVDLNGVIVCDIPWSTNTIKNEASGISSDRLYAVGQDAYLLSQSLPRLTQIPQFPIYGATGALVLTSQHQIHRRLPCKPIQNGHV